MSDYKLLNEGLKKLNREEAKKYYDAFRRWGTNQKHPVDAIFDLIEEKHKKDKNE